MKALIALIQNLFMNSLEIEYNKSYFDFSWLKLGTMLDWMAILKVLYVFKLLYGGIVRRKNSRPTTNLRRADHGTIRRGGNHGDDGLCAIDPPIPMDGIAYGPID